MPWLFEAISASGSIREAWVLLLRFLPWKFLPAGKCKEFVEQTSSHIGCGQPVTVLRERERSPDRLIDAQSYEPTEHQVVVQPLHELPRTASRLQDLKKASPDETLRRHRRASLAGVDLGVDLVEELIAIRPCRINQLAHLSDQIPKRLPFRAALPCRSGGGRQ